MWCVNSTNGGPRRRGLSQRNFLTPFLAGPVAAKYPVRVCPHTYKFTGGCKGKTLQIRQDVQLSTGKRSKNIRDKEKAGNRDVLPLTVNTVTSTGVHPLMDMSPTTRKEMKTGLFLFHFYFTRLAVIFTAGNLRSISRTV